LNDYYENISMLIWKPAQNFDRYTARQSRNQKCA
jgi:hypothetical protein